MSESIICNIRECYICGSQYNVEKHHCIKGTANRRLAEYDGLWVYLCRRHHEKLHSKDGHEMDMAFKRLAEWNWMAIRGYITDNAQTEEGTTAWIERYGKNFL